MLRKKSKKLKTLRILSLCLPRLFPKCTFDVKSRKIKPLRTEPREVAADLETWLQSQGGSLCGIEMRKDQFGLSIYATRDLQIGDIVLTLPVSAACTFHAAKVSKVGRAILSRCQVRHQSGQDGLDGRIAERSVLYSYLIVSRESSISYPHGPYVKCLPDSFSLVSLRFVCNENVASF
jgi:hypothetical protein